MRHDSDAAEDFRGEGTTQRSAGEVVEIGDAFDAECNLRRGHTGGDCGRECRDEHHAEDHPEHRDDPPGYGGRCFVAVADSGHGDRCEPEG